MSACDTFVPKLLGNTCVTCREHIAEHSHGYDDAFKALRKRAEQAETQADRLAEEREQIRRVLLALVNGVHYCVSLRPGALEALLGVGNVLSLTQRNADAEAVLATLTPARQETT